MVARLQRFLLRRRAALDEGEDARALLRHRSRLVAALDDAQRLLGLLAHAGAPGVDVLRRQRLGLERRVAARRGKGAVQLGGACGERLNERQIGGVVLILAQPFDEALEIRKGVAPGVALVRHVRLQQRHRGGLAAAGRQVLDGAGERHAVLEVRHLGKEAADLELRVHALANAAEALQEQPIAERHRGVGALRVQRAQGQHRDFVARELRELRGRRESQDAPVHRQALLLADRLDHVAAERLVGDGIGHHADIRLLAHLGDGERRERAHVVLVLFPAERERQEVGAVAHGDEGDQPRQAADVPDDVVLQLGVAHRFALLRVPALPLDELRQHLDFEALAQLLGHANPPGDHLVAEKREPAVEQHQYRCLLVYQHFLVPIGRADVLRQAEPVKRVGRQRQQIRQVADRRE